MPLKADRHLQLSIIFSMCFSHFFTVNMSLLLLQDAQSGKDIELPGHLWISFRCMGLETSEEWWV
jgi:hypothetical protein